MAKRVSVLALVAGMGFLYGCPDSGSGVGDVPPSAVSSPNSESAEHSPSESSNSSSVQQSPSGAPVNLPPPVATGTRDRANPFVGQWHSCDRRLRFEENGNWIEEDLIVGCSFEGTWTYDGTDLLRELKKTDCSFEGDHSLQRREMGPMEPVMPAVEAEPDRLFLVFRNEITTRLYFGPNVARDAWRFEGTPEGEPARKRVMMARVVGDPQAFFIGSFWSPERDCGAFFGCGGRINNWYLDDKRLSVSASSQGECAIAGTLDGEVQPDGSLQGKYTTIRCGRVERGTFVGKRVNLQ